MANIILKDVYVNGINTQARASTFKDWFVKGDKLSSIKVPILRGVSFVAEHGDKIAILGRNGSGKSSLLKVIGGIYPIESGYREVNGDIVPLIEMGLGFDPELSGRTNIKLSFAYRNKLSSYSLDMEHQIIEFAAIGDKIDLPLKTYSSGMMARLAFSSVIFQEPSIFLIDEVLAVGDQGFLEKSRNVIRDKFVNASISILVNHSFDDIKDLCNRFILMDNGQIILEDTAENVLKKYQMDILHLGTKEQNA